MYYRLASSLESVISQYKAESESKLEDGNLNMTGSMFNGCIASAVLNYNRKRKYAPVENNAHLFAVETPETEDNDGDPVIEDQWERDEKKAKKELEEYEDVD